MKIEIRNMFEVKDALLSMSDGMDSHIASKALYAGGHEFRKWIKSNINSHDLYKTGKLYNSIRVYNVQVGRGKNSVSVGPVGVIYARVHEFGATIKPKNAKMLSWIDEMTGERIFAHQVVIPARPYIRPAYDEHKQDIYSAMANVVMQELSKAGKK